MPGGRLQVHDIEDLCSLGTSHLACPFYGAKVLAKNADIIFAPYNYIVDPIIRSTLSIDLRGAIIVLDEAHNVEDVSIASGSLDYDFRYLYRKLVLCLSCSPKGI